MTQLLLVVIIDPVANWPSIVIDYWYFIGGRTDPVGVIVVIVGGIVIIEPDNLLASYWLLLTIIVDSIIIGPIDCVIILLVKAGPIGQLLANDPARTDNWPIELLNDWMILLCVLLLLLAGQLSQTDSIDYYWWPAQTQRQTQLTQ